MHHPVTPGMLAVRTDVQGKGQTSSSDVLGRYCSKDTNVIHLLEKFGKEQSDRLYEKWSITQSQGGKEFP